MGMVEADALLAHEAHQVRRVALAQHLGRADLLGLRIPGAPDGPGSALGDQVYQREAPDNHVSHSRLSISDRKSTRLNSSHVAISYAVFCLKKKKKLNKSPRNTSWSIT